VDIFIIIAGFAVSAFTAFAFFKAGKFKATSSKETLLQAGFGWIEKIPFGVVRLIAWLEILGAIGVVVAPIGYLLGYAWAIWFAIAAAVGLALTMVGAIWVHAARGETKYTLKMNLNLLVASLVTAGGWFALTLI
jgi:hypothetical protein